ncbi:hypothetical protein G5I_07371 [Acromyrmex echinatior]|uniref:Uncharacterized protein n=1 Tax=Acromyrmex echinatior TaxID=103372 RepID=F4WNL8_ACREC|nr:hypothetical protein G5I_07371 [Acromyrmex echinatior]
MISYGNVLQKYRLENLGNHQCVQNANVPLTCHRMTVVEQFAFHVTGQRPKERSINERDSVKICAIVGCSLASTFSGFRANQCIARGNRQRLSNGQNDYLHARLSAIPIRKSAIDAVIKSSRLLFHAAKQAHRETEFALPTSQMRLRSAEKAAFATVLENRVAVVIAFAGISQRYHDELFADRSSTANTCSSCVKSVNDCHADGFLASHGKLNTSRQVGWISLCVESHYVNRELLDPPDTLIISRYLRRVKPLIPEYYIKKSSTHTMRNEVDTRRNIVVRGVSICADNEDKQTREALIISKLEQSISRLSGLGLPDVMAQKALLGSMRRVEKGEVEEEGWRAGGNAEVGEGGGGCGGGV